MKSLKAALISALAGQGMEIFLFFLGGVLLQKAEDPLKNLPFLTYLFIGLSAVFSGILSKLLHRDGDILTSLITGGILTAISLLLSLFTAQSGKTVGQSLLSAAYIAVPSFAGNVFEKIQSKRKIQSEAGKKAL